MKNTEKMQVIMDILPIIKEELKIPITIILVTKNRKRKMIYGSAKYDINLIRNLYYDRWGRILESGKDDVLIIEVGELIKNSIGTFGNRYA